MTYLWNPDSKINPNNRFYVTNAKYFNMDWEEFRTMYDSLTEEERAKIDKTIGEKIHKEFMGILKLIKEAEKATKSHNIQMS